MDVPIALPVVPMLARLIEELPAPDAIPGGYSYEPKWDGLRCLILSSGTHIELVGRMSRSIARSFPDVVEQARANLPARCVIDGEIVVRRGTPGQEYLDWDALIGRLSPSATRRRGVAPPPAEFIAFDMLAAGSESLMQRPFRERRARLEDLAQQAPGMRITRNTTDLSVAQGWLDLVSGSGLDGVMVKARDSRYEPGKRSMLKMKRRYSAEAVVIGYQRSAESHGIGSVELGMYNEAGQLVPIGRVASVPEPLGAQLELLLTPSSLTARVPRRARATTPAVSVEPTVVVEVTYDQLEHARLRHQATLMRLRPDRDAQSCRTDQLHTQTRYDLDEVFVD